MGELIKRLLDFLSRNFWGWVGAKGERNDADTLRDMLKNFPKPMRKFSTLKGKVRGLEDNEVRRILRGLDAVSFTSREGEELWGLKSRNLTATSVDGP